MASFITRVERASPIARRITGLIRSGQMEWCQRPLWYDVYNSNPPYEDPVWDLKMPKANEAVRPILFKEDIERAKEFKGRRIRVVAENLLLPSGFPTLLPTAQSKINTLGNSMNASSEKENFIGRTPEFELVASPKWTCFDGSEAYRRPNSSTKKSN